MPPRKTNRNSNLELLRIISIVLIIAHHYSVHGFNIQKLGYCANQFLVGFLSLGGKFGVSCFVLISGYFMVSSRFTVYKLIKLIAEVLFYSIGIGLIFLFVLTPVTPLSPADITPILMPVGSESYWFITSYIVMMLFSPILNFFINHTNQKTHLQLLLPFIVIWSILPCCFKSVHYGTNNSLWFIILYLIAGYLRKYVDIEKENASRHFAVGMICYFLIAIYNAAIIYLSHMTSAQELLSQSSRLSGINSPLILLSSVELLLGFLKMRPHYSRFINTLASASFGVYLIHDNRFMRPYLWKTLFKNSQWYSSHYLILHAIAVIFSIYVVCTLIDLIRQATAERLLLRFFDKYLERIKNFFHSIWICCEKRILSFLQQYYG